MYLVELSKHAMKDRNFLKSIGNTENLMSQDGTPYDGIVRVKRMWTHYE